MSTPKTAYAVITRWTAAGVDYEKIRIFTTKQHAKNYLEFRDSDDVDDLSKRHHIKAVQFYDEDFQQVTEEA